MITKQQRAEIAELITLTAKICVNPDVPAYNDLMQAATLLRSEPKIQARWVRNHWWMYDVAENGEHGWMAHFDHDANSDIVRLGLCYESEADAKQACLKHAQRLLAQLTGEGEA